MEHIDVKKDYYLALGLTPDASAEELKAAYINLALQYHPDTAPIAESKNENLSQSRQAQFITVSEAWSILSKPEMRAFYDKHRSRFIGRDIGSVAASNLAQSLSDDHKVISEGFNTQRVNFKGVQSRASSTWQDMQEKYKSEKWHKMSLDQRKVKRIRPVNSVGGSALKILVPVVICGALVFANSL